MTIQERLEAGAKAYDLDNFSHNSFIDDLGADSLGFIALLQELEEEFNIEISDEDAQKFKTVEEAVRYIESKKG